MLEHNRKMQAFLASHGIEVLPKYIPDGSLKGTWRLYNKSVKWSIFLANILNSIGFRDYNGKPLGIYSGNGGIFCIFVRGHEEMKP